MSITQPARGMRDILPSDARRREYVIRTIKEVYERYGFAPLETPAVERLETLQGKYGEEAGGLIFKILKRGEGEASGEADLALRYDLTVPLARVVAEYQSQLPKIFKRYQIQPVYRAERPARGRFREFYQCDVDVVGSSSATVEAELCLAAGDALTKLGFKNYTIRLNHRGVLAGLLDAAGVPGEKHTDALVALDKLDKIGVEGVTKELAGRGVDESAGARLLSFFAELKQLERAAELVADDVLYEEASAEGLQAEGNDLHHDALNKSVLGRIVEFIGDHAVGARGAEELRRILDLAEASDPRHRLRIDPGLARGLSYYTGAIMEISVPDLAGSLGGGGRYDNLVGMFLKQPIPACGFSLGLERIIVVMTEREMFPPELERAGVDCVVTVWDEASMDDSIAIARLLHDGGLRVDLYPDADKVRNQIKYASAAGVPFIVLAGPDERARGEVALKDLRSGEQQNVLRADAARIIHERL